jgi:CRP-like cAMP-binding protein
VQVIVLLEGEVTLMATSTSEHKTHVIDLQPGDVVAFGALLKVPEFCAAVAKTEVQVAMLALDVFERFVHKEVRDNITNFVP